MSEPTPEEGREHVRTLVNGIRERDAVIKKLLAQLPSDGQGRWRQGTKNPQNCYVHQGDDEVGKPVGQMYSAQLAALVCDAVNAQQAEDRADMAIAQRVLDQGGEGVPLDKVLHEELRERIARALAAEHSRPTRQGTLISPDIYWAALADAVMAVVQPEIDSMWDQIHRDQHDAMDAEAQLDQLKAAVSKFRDYLDRDFRQWCSPYGIASDYATKLIDELDRTIAPVESDLPAVREFAAKHDPRKEPT